MAGYVCSNIACSYQDHTSFGLGLTDILPFWTELTSVQTCPHPSKHKALLSLTVIWHSYKLQTWFFLKEVVLFSFYQLDGIKKQNSTSLSILSYHNVCQALFWTLHIPETSDHMEEVKREIFRFKLPDSISCLGSSTEARKYHAFQFIIVIVHRDMIVCFWNVKNPHRAEVFWRQNSYLLCENEK